MKPTQPARTVPPPEADRLPLVKILYVALAVLGLFALGIFVAEVEHAHVAEGLGPPKGLPAPLGEEKINEVNTQVFELNLVEVKRREAQTQRLHSYGWVDRAHGRVHVPLDVARAQMLDEQGAAK